MNTAVFFSVLTIVLYIVIAVAVVALFIAVWRYIHRTKQ